MERTINYEALEMGNIQPPDLPRPDCPVSCPVYVFMKDLDAGIFVKNAEISQLQLDIQKLKGRVTRTEKRLDQQDATLENVQDQLKRCHDENVNLKKIVEKQEVVVNYFKQEFENLRVLLDRLFQSVSSHGIPVPDVFQDPTQG